jgi:hypothetical protein
MHIATVEQIANQLIPAISELRDTFVAKSKEYSRVVMVGAVIHARVDRSDRNMVQRRRRNAPRSCPIEGESRHPAPVAWEGLPF